MPPTNRDDNITLIRNFCKALSSYNVSEILMEYDGSGDSGDGDFSVILPVIDKSVGSGGVIGTPAENRASTEYKSFRGFMENIFKQKDPLVTEKATDEFEDAVFSLLPGGWEINDGSYGTVSVDVATGAIKVEHNERYTEINSSEFNY